MDTNQGKIIELLREVHLIAFREIERLNMKIAELENQRRHGLEVPPNPTIDNPPTVTKQPAFEVLNEKQVAVHLNISVATVRRWRLFRTGPTYLKIGSAVRYKRRDVEAWLDACRASR